MTIDSQQVQDNRLQHLISLKNLGKEHIDNIFERAATFLEVAKRRLRAPPVLAGKLVFNAFYEPSTRTRLAFEVAAKALGAEVVNLDITGSSTRKGEKFSDTARNLIALGADMIVIRHFNSRIIHSIATAAPTEVAIINAGAGYQSHPTQGLQDAWTIVRERGSLAGLKITLIGDILHSRVARSDIHIFTTLGAKSITACGPPSLVPSSMAKLVTIKYDADDAIAGADVIVALRMQHERMAYKLPLTAISDYQRDYSIDQRRLALAAPHAMLLHPGPIERGIELANEVADGPQSFILTQVTNGIAIRMAVMAILSESRTVPVT